MKVLANGKHAKVDELIYEKDACVSDPTPVAITMLNNLSKDHEERERSKNRNQPKHKVVDGCPWVYCEMQNRKRSESCGYITKAHNSWCFAEKTGWILPADSSPWVA